MRNVLVGQAWALGPGAAHERDVVSTARRGAHRGAGPVAALSGEARQARLPRTMSAQRGREAAP